MLAVGAGILVAPPVQAHPAQGAEGVRLTTAAIEKLSKRYQTRIDGTPGQVAAMEGPAAAAPALPATLAKSATGSGAHADSASTAPGFKRTGQWETARGFAEGVALGGTKDWVSVFSGGTVGRYDAQGKQVWNRGAASLYQDWQVTPANWFQPYPYLPNLYAGYNPYQMSATGKRPYATGDFNGDGVDDVAVAYAVGDWPLRPFSSPGSQVDYGAFLTILDGRTGSTAWTKLLPGFVGSMLVQDGELIVADSTGPDWGADPVAEQGDSRSNLTAYRFSRAAHGKLTGTADWTYSTHAPWAHWGDLTPMGADRVAASWSDTPMGLGTPRPADGNVLVLDASDGSVAAQAKTPGYPRMLVKDPGADRVLVVEQNDPFDRVRWDLTAIDAHSGARTVLASREGTVPETFQVLPDAHGGRPRFAVAELGINADLSDGQSTVSGWDAQGRTLWTYTTASTVGGHNAPVMEVSFDANGGEVLASLSDPTNATAAAPSGPEHTQLVALKAATGRLDWRQEGAVSGDTFTPYQGGLLTVGYDDTAYTVNPHSGALHAMPLAGDPYAAVATDVNGDGVKDLITAGESRGVFALDGRTLKKATPAVLWEATVDSSVHTLQLLQAGGKGGSGDSVVAATDHGFAVLGTHTGEVRANVHTGGFVASLTVAGDGHGGSAVVVPGSSLTAYTAQGRKLWTYRPKGTEGKSLVFSSVTTDATGHLFLEYGGTHQGIGLPTEATDPAPTAVSLDAATGAPVWTETPTDPGAVAVVPTNPALAGPNIPDSDGHGVAFAYTGDFRTYHHLVQILDSRTGAVIRNYESPGMSQGFVASKKTGMVEMREFNDYVYPADGGEPYDVPTFLGFHSGVLARSVGGTEAFVGAYQNLWSYDTPFADNDGFLRESATDFALGASQVQTVNLGDGPGDDIIGLALDWRALNISARSIGDAVNDIDYMPHGLTTYKLSEDEPTRIPGPPNGDASAAALQTASAAGQSHDGPLRSASPLKDLALPIGTASVPIEIQSRTPAAKKLSVGSDNAGEVTRGYTPQQIQARLGLRGDGTGQTVAIVDAYHYPTAKEDLNHFSAHFGLPQTCDAVSAGTSCFDFQQVYADGTQPDVDTGWNEEAALDIEWAHSVAPRAKIVLVEGTDAGMAALARADDVAAALHPAAVSNSWGTGEFSEQGFYDGHCKLADSVCVQSTGDGGYPGGYSATNPYALAIGGTNLQLDADGNTLDETAWRSTGGGLSYFEPRPAYQDGVQSSPLRATPDVSFVADPATGVPVYLTMASGDATTSVWLKVGGTSLSAPIWGAIIASADQLRATDGKPHLASDGPDGDTAHTDVYALDGSYLRDITAGSNGRCGTECTAGPGYDTVTGLGSPTAGVDAALAAME
ncbi:PQQ-binding-like beta-propeller repeat protein [Streptacidiphilus griseoplanus]|uniref:PQQ-binding-like beta-propeller repeat protein n=1 Tax=Peterkaempfera griseoplana TaxID=66896 RepID=UPI0006E3BC82|nr:PQQ-binding-like beta-propeller repeat protein [Peterkaempfera griseoplana]